MKGNLRHFIAQFLSCQTLTVDFRGACFCELSQFEGVSQGSILRTTLFIVAINDIARKNPPLNEMLPYLDDFMIWAIGLSPSIVTLILQDININRLTMVSLSRPKRWWLSLLSDIVAFHLYFY